MASYQAGAQALAQVPYPWNFAAMASVIASGLVQVGKIAGVADAGVSNVSENATYKLTTGERVLAPAQNKDLTEFLKAPSGVGEMVNNWNILPNATNLEALHSISDNDWIELIRDKMFPAMEELKRRGIKVYD